MGMGGTGPGWGQWQLEISSPCLLFVRASASQSVCVRACVHVCVSAYACVWRVGFYFVLMLRFWFISSYGSGLVTLIRHQVKIKPHGLVGSANIFLCTIAFVWCCWPSATKLAPKIWFPISPALSPHPRPYPHQKLEQRRKRSLFAFPASQSALPSRWVVSSPRLQAVGSF